MRILRYIYAFLFARRTQAAIGTELGKLTDRTARAEALAAKADERLLDAQILANQLSDRLRQLEAAQRQYANEIEHLRAQLQVAEETTIPALVASNTLLLQRIEADTAIQVRARVGALPMRGEDR